LGAIVQTPLGSLFRFGPFEVNSASGELLKNGNRIKLQEQPFRLLIVLLENAGDVVSREELRHRIWRDDIFVDFDGSLRVAVGKLREALGDNAENPRYVETIPKRGYRFLAPEVYPEAHPDVLHPSIRQDGNSVPGEIAVAAAPPAAIRLTSDPAAQTGEASRRLRWWIGGSLLLLVVVAGVLVTLLSRRSRKVLTEKDTIVLADFANSTGDPVFDETLRQGLAVQLEQSPFLSLVPEERIQQLLGLMGKSVETRLTPEIAHEVCERTASAAVLDGSITRMGTQYVLGLRAKDCRTGKILAEEQAQAARKEDVLNALSQIASKLRTQLGESLATVEKHNTPLAEATTPSLEALKAYSTGLRVESANGEPAAVPFFQRATEIDSQFATAYASLGLMYGAMGESALSAVNTTKAYELRDHASDAERFFITASYDGRVTGDFEKAQQTCESWARMYTREKLPHAYLAGFIYPASGNYVKAIEEAQRIIDLGPDSAIGYLMLAANYVDEDQLDQAQASIRHASERKLNHPDFAALRYDIAFLKKDAAAMEREVAASRETSEGTDWLSVHQAFVLAYSGHLREAKTMSRRAVDLADQAANKERAALFQSGEAVWEAFYGEPSLAKRDATAALAISNNREVEYGAALAFALSGDSSQAQTLAHDLEIRFPEDTSVRFSYLPVLRGTVALNQGLPSKAIDLLQVAVPYDLGTQRSTIHGFFGALYPIFVRGNAFLASRRGADAAAEFHKILDQPGIVVSDPVGLLAHLQLARSYVLLGEKAEARSAYADFLTLWKDADSDAEILKQAKAEYANLR
jgi:eukaryotic-like serine/threonine-protein kinase